MFDASKRVRVLQAVVNYCGVCVAYVVADARLCLGGCVRACACVLACFFKSMLKILFMMMFCDDAYESHCG